MNPLLTLSGTEIARRIRDRSLSSREAVSTHIDRIRRVNPTLNAIVQERFDNALSEADAADQAIAAGKAPDVPFYGVPCSIKECFALTGMQNTSGLVSRIGVVAQEDAPAVRRIRGAGAIPMGVTNVSELCMWMESNNKVYGRTNNPYDPRHIVGGSSGGEGAIIASGGSPFGVGSDIGGSIRMPAFFNGIFGHKPTGGLIPNTGQYPNASNEARHYLATGPLARRCEDLWPLVRIMAGTDSPEDGCLPWKLGDPESVDLSQLTVYCIPDNGKLRVSKDIQGALQRSAAALEEAGAKVVHTRIPELKRSFDIWSSMLEASGGPTFRELLADGKPFEPATEVLRMILGRSPYTFPGLGLALLESVTKMTPARNRRFVEKGIELRAQLVDMLGPNGVMLFPPYPTVAPRHNVPLFPPLNWVYTAILNVMELPVTAVPTGLNSRGLPTGVQVAGIHGNDHVTVAVALELERRLGGWVPPVNQE